MYNMLLDQRIVVSAVAAFAGLVYLIAAIRVSRCGEASAPARYGVAAFAFVVAVLVTVRVLEPVVAYSLTCVSLVAVFLMDLLRDERARRRRIALLAPRPAADRVPTVWIAITLLSALPLVPYVLGGIDVASALIASGCVIAMAAIAWRVASAPMQLTSEDPRTEHLRDRADRARHAGLTCVVAIGSVALFVGFVNATPPTAGGLGRVTDVDMLMVWGGLWIWQTWYVRRLSRAACTAAS
jgi:hypothetical protein